MKSILSATLIALIASSAAHAEGLQLETRIFHAAKNERISSVKTYENGTYGSTIENIDHDYDTTAGAGVAASVSVLDQLDAGVGYSFARYFRSTTSTQVDQTLQLFTRYNVQKSENSKFYLLAGVSEHRLKDDVSEPANFRFRSSFAPITNYDVGLGGSLKLGSVDLGLEYKYSNTLAKARAQIVSRSYGFGLVEEQKLQLKGVELEGHEVSVTLGVKI